MAKANPTLFTPVRPFPSDIDRNSFGHWLSGFVDGEATFYLGLQKSGFCVRMVISLRSDDRPILELVQGFLGCGTLSTRPNYSNPHLPPLTLLDVSDVNSLHNIVVPHFHRFPLRAKKRNDFLIWERAVALCWTVQCRKAVSRGFGLGTFPKWADTDREEFKRLHDELRAGRRYDEPPPATL